LFFISLVYDFCLQVKVKSKTKTEFGHLNLIQELNINSGPGSSPNNSTASLKESQSASVDASRAIFALKFSPDGNYLAAAGAEGVIRIWRLLPQAILDGNASAAGSNDPSAHLTSLEALKVATIFEEDPIQVLRGHGGEILDLAWSTNNFLLSASMDKTVRLWHYSRFDSLGIFEHLDYVTSIAFHPRDPRFFVSGSLDCKLRLWSIQEQAIQSWNELPPGNFITAVAFTRTGKSVIAGTAGGIALIFETEGLRYHTQIHVRSSKSMKGKKITGIEAVPGNFGDERVRISS
jgi:WD40 repeat protein